MITTLAFVDMNTPELGAINLFTAAMEQHALKNINNCLNTSIYSLQETSSGQSSNVVHLFNASFN